MKSIELALFFASAAAAQYFGPAFVAPPGGTVGGASDLQTVSRIAIVTAPVVASGRALEDARRSAITEIPHEVKIAIPPEGR